MRGNPDPNPLTLALALALAQTLALPLPLPLPLPLTPYPTQVRGNLDKLSRNKVVNIVSIEVLGLAPNP